MTYLVLARKYRPERFEAVVGQEPIARTLRNALQAGRLAHAYLFTGPRGVGKTSMARILARALRCERGPTPDPCDQCASCKAVRQGNDLDVIEIDGASNRGIENIRDLRESVRYAPSRGGYKVYIVDEVHQITQDAFNAFLKTLEEPPAHVVFVFATTEPAKVPETIRSRCQEFEFRRIPEAGIAATLRAIAEKEELQLEAGIEHEIARRARGGLRDALSLLDQLCAYGDGKVTFQAYQELTGYLAPARVAEMFDAAVRGDAAAALRWVSDAFSRGASGGDLLDQWMDYCRALLHRAAGSAEARPLPGLDESVVQSQAEQIDSTQLLGWLQVLLEARRQLRLLEDEALLLEMVALELVRIADLPALDSVLVGLPSDSSAGAARVRPEPPARAAASAPRERAPARPARAAPGAAVSRSPAPSAGLEAEAGEAVPAAEPPRPRAPRHPDSTPPSSALSGPAHDGGEVADAASDRPARLLEEIKRACLRAAPSLLAVAEAVEAERLEEGVLWVRVRPGEELPEWEPKLDAEFRRVTQKALGRSIVLRWGRPDVAVTEIPPQVKQVRDVFGGDTVSG